MNENLHSLSSWPERKGSGSVLLALISDFEISDSGLTILMYILQGSDDIEFKSCFHLYSFLDFVPGTATEFKVPMSPWTNYTFRVIARNKVGDSLPSDVSKDCQTPEDVPYKNPDNVMGRGNSSRNLIISWTVRLRPNHNQYSQTKCSASFSERLSLVVPNRIHLKCEFSF